MRARKPTSPTLRSIQVGQPKEVLGAGLGGGSPRPWRTSLFKDAVEGSVSLEHDGLAGDAQADLRHHGGADKAVCVYPTEHYPYWERRLGRRLPAAAFGENFSVLGLDEGTVCVGDTFAVGEALVQVTQPRSPCWKVSRRWHEKLALWFQETGFTGWYLRVVEPGVVRAGQQLELVERPFEHWTVERLNRVRYGDAPDDGELDFLARCPALSDGWRTRFRNALAGKGRGEDQRRLHGEP